MPSSTISVPAGYAPAFAVGFANSSSGEFSVVDPDRPLPVLTVRPEASAPLSGTVEADTIAGPFTPTVGRPVFITLTGDWQGTVAMTRSIDGGLTRQPLTLAGSPWGVFTANACEAFWEEHETGAALYLAATVASGTLGYRLSQ